jgi:hypothetical protein
MGLSGSTTNASLPHSTNWNGVLFSPFIPSGLSGRTQSLDNVSVKIS